MLRSLLLRDLLKPGTPVMVQVEPRDTNKTLGFVAEMPGWAIRQEARDTKGYPKIGHTIPVEVEGRGVRMYPPQRLWIDDDELIKALWL